jgi:hypothetical protein
MNSQHGAESRYKVGYPDKPVVDVDVHLLAGALTSLRQLKLLYIHRIRTTVLHT